MKKLERPVQMAVIGAAHGIRGEVRVKSFTGDPLALGDYGPLYAEDGRRFDIAATRPSGEVVVVRFKQVADRNAAETLTGLALFIDRSALPADLEDEEFYHADLIGLAVRDAAGEAIGKVHAFHDYGAGDILELRLADGRGAMVPFTRAAVPVVDIAGGHIVVEPNAAGLVPDDDEAEAEKAKPQNRPRGPKSAGGNR